MIKARVSKNLKGGLMLPTLSKRAYVANQEVFFTEEQMFAADIQVSLNKKLLVLSDGSKFKNAVSQMTRVTNLSFGSVSLPGVGVLQAGRSMDIRTDLIDTPPFQKLEDQNLVAYDLKFKAKKEEEETPKKGKGKTKIKKADEVPANMQKGKPITVKISTNEDGRPIAETVQNNLEKKARSGASAQRAAEEALLVDPNIDEDGDSMIDPRTGKRIEKTDDIIFVDAEQVKDRMNPRLKAKYEADKANGDVSFVDIDGAQARMNPRLKGKNK